MPKTVCDEDLWRGIQSEGIMTWKESCKMNKSRILSVIIGVMMLGCSCFCSCAKKDAIQERNNDMAETTIETSFNNSEKVNSAVVLPPSRIGLNDNGKTIYATRYSLVSAIKEADAIAHVRIGNWIGEDTIWGYTYFETKVIECYKGDLPENIILEQEGCSSWTIKGYPLYTAGDEWFLFLRRTYNDPINDHYSAFREDGNTYHGLNDFLTVMIPIKDDFGEDFLLDQRGGLSENNDLNEFPAEIYNYAKETHRFKNLSLQLTAKDPLMEEYNVQLQYIYLKEDIISLINDLRRE